MQARQPWNSSSCDGPELGGGPGSGHLSTLGGGRLRPKLHLGRMGMSLPSGKPIIGRFERSRPCPRSSSATVSSIRMPTSQNRPTCDLAGFPPAGQSVFPESSAWAPRTSGCSTASRSASPASSPWPASRARSPTSPTPTTTSASDLGCVGTPRPSGRRGYPRAVLYPNVGGFGSGRFLSLGEPELMLACVRAYNDFLAGLVLARIDCPARPRNGVSILGRRTDLGERDRPLRAGPWLHRAVLTCSSASRLGPAGPSVRQAPGIPVWAAAQGSRACP